MNWARIKHSGGFIFCKFDGHSCFMHRKTNCSVVFAWIQCAHVFVVNRQQFPSWKTSHATSCNWSKKRFVSLHCELSLPPFVVCRVGGGTVLWWPRGGSFSLRQCSVRDRSQVILQLSCGRAQQTGTSERLVYNTVCLYVDLSLTVIEK